MRMTKAQSKRLLAYAADMAWEADHVWEPGSHAEAVARHISVEAQHFAYWGDTFTPIPLAYEMIMGAA